MSRHAKNGGATAKGDRIQLDFWWEAKRYRPTLQELLSEVNLRAARKRLEGIKRRIRQGTFIFADEFPEYRFLEKTAPFREVPTFKVVAIRYLRSVKSELDYATFESYRRLLGIRPEELTSDKNREQNRETCQYKQARPPLGFWAHRIGEKRIDAIKYSDLMMALSEGVCSRKSRNNRVGVVKLVFRFAMLDSLIPQSPAEGLKSLKLQKRNPDPYTAHEAEAIIAGIREDWGDYDGNYVEFSFFAGVRPSEAIALKWPDVDFRRGYGSD